MGQWVAKIGLDASAGILRNYSTTRSSLLGMKMQNKQFNLLNKKLSSYTYIIVFFNFLLYKSKTLITK